MTTNRPTKKSFREYLNAQPELNARQDRRGSLRGAAKRAYGDWLYSADRDMFNHLYSYYVIHGTIEGM